MMKVIIQIWFSLNQHSRYFGWYKVTLICQKENARAIVTHAMLYSVQCTLSAYHKRPTLAIYVHALCGKWLRATDIFNSFNDVHFCINNFSSFHQLVCTFHMKANNFEGSRDFSNGGFHFGEVLRPKHSNEKMITILMLMQCMQMRCVVSLATKLCRSKVNWRAFMYSSKCSSHCCQSVSSRRKVFRIEIFWELMLCFQKSS